MESILLGLNDGELDPNRHRTTFITNKVGGEPDWCHGLRVPCPRCAHCGAPLALVVQIYCPLDVSPPYHRNLHLFACPAAGCNGRGRSWRALRSQSLVDQARTNSHATAAQEPPLSATEWCAGADDWGAEEGESDGWGAGVKKEIQSQVKEKKEAATETDGGAALSSGFQDLCLEGSRDNAPVFRPFFISVIEESDLGVEGDGNQEHVQQLLKEYEHREGVVVEELDHAQDVSSGGEEKYEKSSARHGDAIFSRFMKRISLCPQQILRYHRSGEPLFISEPPSNLTQVVLACSTCGGRRTFELQLMPALVSLLRRVDGGPEEELDFGSVLVFTCTNSCWTEVSEFKEEFCFVQDDPDQQLFK